MGNAARWVAQQVRQDLKAGKLVVGREQGMRLRGALDLLDLDQRLVTYARRGVGGVDRTALVIDLGWVHATVLEVGIVRDRQEFVADLALTVHPVPQIHGLDRAQSAE